MSVLKGFEFKIFYSSGDNTLHNFYIPALSRSVKYDRSAGYFSSTTLAIAAEGVAHLIKNGGKMRLLVGADLSQQDVEAIQQGHDLQEKVAEKLLMRFPNPQNALMEKRLEVLAWMIADGTLEIKVVLPKDEYGFPIPASQSQDYYHPKNGIFTDKAGNKMAFSGSINESISGWVNNFEEINIFKSWEEGNDPQRISNFEVRFINLWSGKDPHWISLDIPQAVRDCLIRYKPNHAPERDPLEKLEIKAKPQVNEIPENVLQIERIQFQFLRDAPYFPHATGLGTHTSAVIPWPHQSQVSNSVLQRFPESVMLSDEVGLGKTIEAGLLIRQLWLSGWVKRCLILAPKSVLRQWQGELYEKFGLNIPRYNQGQFHCYFNDPLQITSENPWNDHDIMLVGSQLAKRHDRREQFLNAKPWDLIIVDEAHHARRKDFLQPTYRPNQLLSLLRDLINHHQVKTYFLITATPMQVDAREVWDLLGLLGLGGHWGANERNFVNFYQELRKPFNATNWDFVYDLVADFISTTGYKDETILKEIRNQLGVVKLALFEELISPSSDGQREQLVKKLGKTSKHFIDEFARRHTPIKYYVFRNTRDLLREYQKQGILKARIPTRSPDRVRVQMTSIESDLYKRIEEYIANFYHKYENERCGLGFVMTVYRRRLTSSFYAVRRSLERRLDYLKGQIGWAEAYSEDDTEQDELDFDLSLDVDEGHLSESDQQRFAEEADYVEDFINELRSLAINDSKLEQLKQDLANIFLSRSTILVFTQYTDTMDYLRDQLVIVYGRQVACYSGRGGEIWNGIAWVQDTKENVKNNFKEGKIRILLCTESASEGLNLQTCGVMINYDMPWNPMRVEQRIGRIDRIGQTYDEVWIKNYFYKETIEDQIYQRLSNRISWFKTVVGRLQPILARVEEITRNLAMLSADERQIKLDKLIRALENQLDRNEVEALNLDDFTEDIEPVPTIKSPVTLNEIEKLFTTSRSFGHLFSEHPTIDEAFELDWKGQKLQVTFSKSCFDEHPSTLQFLTYGNQLFQEMLSEIDNPTSDWKKLHLYMVHNQGNWDIRSWYAQGKDQPKLIETYAELKDLLDQNHSTPAVTMNNEIVKEKFKETVEEIFRKKQIIEERKHLAKETEIKARAQILLKEAALIEIALGRSQDLFSDELYPHLFNENAMLGLRRYGYPWAPLLKLAYLGDIKLEESGSFFQQIANRRRESLRGLFIARIKEAEKIVDQLYKVMSDDLDCYNTQEMKIDVSAY